jgi:GNAT superfamily N-acetyltransferase
MTAEEASFSMRDGDAEDLPIIKQILYEALAWSPARALPPLDHLMVHPEVIRYHRDWGRPGDLAVIAVQDGKVIGGAFCRTFTDDDHGHGYVDPSTPELAIAVFDGHRGRGVGGALLDALEDRARRAGFAQISLSYDTENPAGRLYARAGYQPVFQDAEGIRMLKRL